MIPTLEDIIRGLLDGTMTAEQARRYLAEHEKLQAEVDAVTTVPWNRARCLMDVINKCHEQDARWGLGSTYPAFDASLMASADTTAIDLASYYGVPTPRRARLTTASRASELAWMDVLVEEVAKLNEKHDSPGALREQLIDVAAVATQWAASMTTGERVEPDHEGPGSDADDPA